MNAEFEAVCEQLVGFVPGNTRSLSHPYSIPENSRKTNHRGLRWNEKRAAKQTVKSRLHEPVAMKIDDPNSPRDTAVDRRDASPSRGHFDRLR